MMGSVSFLFCFFQIQKGLKDLDNEIIMLIVLWYI